MIATCSDSCAPQSKTARYSDACDYVMQCMYEENSQLAPGKPFWFQEVLTDDIMFWISFTPIKVSDIGKGFCFPDLQSNGDVRSSMLILCRRPVDD